MAAGTDGAVKTAPYKLPVHVISQGGVLTPPCVCGGNSLVCCHVGADSISARAVRVTTNPRGRDKFLPCDTPKSIPVYFTVFPPILQGFLR